MTTLSEMMILLWLFYLLLHSFHLVGILLHSLMLTDQSRKEYLSQSQGIGAIDTFKYKNARCDFVAITEKNE